MNDLTPMRASLPQAALDEMKVMYNHDAWSSPKEAIADLESAMPAVEQVRRWLSSATRIATIDEVRRWVRTGYQTDLQILRRHRRSRLLRLEYTYRPTVEDHVHRPT
jgi:hypothetical protein